MFSLLVFAANYTQLSENILIFTTMPKCETIFVPDEFIIMEKPPADKKPSVLSLLILLLKSEVLSFEEKNMDWINPLYRWDSDTIIFGEKLFYTARH